MSVATEMKIAHVRYQTVLHGPESHAAGVARNKAVLALVALTGPEFQVASSAFARASRATPKPKRAPVVNHVLYQPKGAIWMIASRLPTGEIGVTSRDGNPLAFTARIDADAEATRTAQAHGVETRVFRARGVFDDARAAFAGEVG